MSTLSCGFLNRYMTGLRELARREEISMNQLIATAVAEKISALDTVEYLEERAARASREEFLRALGRAPDGEPVPGNELPDALKGE